MARAGGQGSCPVKPPGATAVDEIPVDEIAVDEIAVDETAADEIAAW
jgi:hypothetical protein